MSKKKKKFSLTKLAHKHLLNEGDTLYFVSDDSITCKIYRQDFDGEFKVQVEEEVLTVHEFATRCLGAEPPDHASRWFRDKAGKTLYELWHAEDDIDLAA